MFRPAFFGSLLAFVLIGLSLSPTTVFGQDRKIEPAVYTAPTLNLEASPTVVTTCAGDGNQALVHLDAKATSGNLIRYSWRASGGRIEGDGPSVTWDLAGVEPGYYKAFLEVDTGSNDEKCQTFSSTTVLVKCLPPPPVCPNVSIVCPVQIAVDQPITFSANLVGGSDNAAATYNWTVSAGRIMEGQGTTSITVDTKGLAGQTITANFSVGGYPQDCPATCVVQIPLPKVECRKFDEFPDISRNDEKARLDNFVVELQNDPTATAYIVVYPGAGSRPGDVQRHTSRVVDYLVNSRGLNAGRIATVMGPSRHELMVELRVCPQGAIPPKP